MSFGDSLIGQETIYKGIKFKSSLETQIVYILDRLGIKWQYEPKRFRLSNGIIYIPDFYLPELKTWIEGKGRIEDHNRLYSKLFVQEYREPLILMSYEDWFYYGDDFDEVYEDENLQIGKCETCQAVYFSSVYGDYTCKKCRVHNGDHNFHFLNQFFVFKSGINALKNEVENGHS